MQTLCVTGGVGGHREGITHNLKDISIMRLNRLVQNFMMPRQKSGHCARIVLRELGRALDVCEEEGDGAGGESHYISSSVFRAKSNASSIDIFSPSAQAALKADSSRRWRACAMALSDSLVINGSIG